MGSRTWCTTATGTESATPVSEAHGAARTARALLRALLARRRAPRPDVPDRLRADVGLPPVERARGRFRAARGRDRGPGVRRQRVQLRGSRGRTAVGPRDVAGVTQEGGAGVDQQDVAGRGALGPLVLVVQDRALGVERHEAEGPLWNIRLA